MARKKDSLEHVSIAAVFAREASDGMEHVSLAAVFARETSRQVVSENIRNITMSE